MSDGEGARPADLLADVLLRAGLWDRLASARLGGAPPRIVIKPHLGGFARGSPAATDPALVEALIDLLHERGYQETSVVAASDSSSLWADNRSVLPLADLLGYGFVTPAGRAYDVLDLAEHLRPIDLSLGTVLHGSEISRTWADAGFRIVFSKNRTDEAEGFALALDDLIGVLPLADKDYYYRQRFDPGDVVVDLLRAAPPDFAIVDAIVSAHGSGGSRAPRAIDTGTLIASSSAMLADYAGALKMGLDPYVSRINARAMRQLGLPPSFRIDGNLAPYRGWCNVQPIVIEATRARAKSVAIGRSVSPWIQRVDAESFPLKEPLDARINAAIAPRVEQLDDRAAALALFLLGSFGIGWAHEAGDALSTLMRKDAVRRRRVSLGVDPATYADDDFAAGLRELTPLHALLRDLEPDENALRWRHLDGAVLFEIERVFPVPFDEFVDRVDVARTIQFMSDYIGGVVVPVARDERGRVIRQAERNLYLPQPNYVVLYGGTAIDVTKLELAEYSTDRHRLSWKTIRSENGSAAFDDGIVTFAAYDGDTKVTIFGRQLFTLPRVLEAARLEMNPSLHRRLITDAYTSFFNRTFANFEALLEGRDIAIGRSWHEPEPAGPGEPVLAQSLAMKALELGQRYYPLIEQWLRRPAAAPPAMDANGFAHFSAADAAAATPEPSPDLDAILREISTFVAGLTEAIQRDATVRPERSR